MVFTIEFFHSLFSIILWVTWKIFTFLTLTSNASCTSRASSWSFLKVFFLNYTQKVLGTEPVWSRTRESRGKNQAQGMGFRNLAIRSLVQLMSYWHLQDRHDWLLPRCQNYIDSFLISSWHHKYFNHFLQMEIVKSVVYFVLL